MWVVNTNECACAWQADVSTTSDGFVHFGQKVMLVNCGDNSIPAVALSRWMPLGSGDDDLLASATTGLQQSARTIFTVERWVL